MTSILDREPILAEIADLRDEVAELREEVRQLREAMTPISAYPVSWRLTPSEARLLHALAPGHAAIAGAGVIVIASAMIGRDSKVRPKPVPQ